MEVFRELRGVNVKFLSSNPEKAHPCAEPLKLTWILMQLLTARSKINCKSVMRGRPGGQKLYNRFGRLNLTMIMRSEEHTSELQSR